MKIWGFPVPAPEGYVCLCVVCVCGLGGGGLFAAHALCDLWPCSVVSCPFLL